MIRANLPLKKRALTVDSHKNGEKRHKPLTEQLQGLAILIKPRVSPVQLLSAVGGVYCELVHTAVCFIRL